MSHRPWFTADLISLFLDLIKMAAVPAAAVALAWIAFPYLFPLAERL